MQNWFYLQSAEYGKYYIGVDVNGYGAYNIWIGMIYSDGSVGHPANTLTTSNKSSARRKYNKFIQDAETDAYGWNYKVPDLSWKFDINTELNSVQEYILSNPKNIKASSDIRRVSNMKKYVKASRIGKTKEVFVVQEYTGYGRNGWEDVCEYPDNSSESWKEAKQDVKDYKDNGYSARIIRRRVPNQDYVVPEVTSSNHVECASNGNQLQNTANIEDLPDDTVIRVDEVLDYARKYMKPEDIDHYGYGRGMDDLYLRVNDVSRWIVNHMDNTALVSKFVDNIDHVWWYELPFLYHD